MLQWFASLTRLVFDIGYPGIILALIIEGLGLPFPGDACMAFYGFAAAAGNFSYVGVLCCSVVGYVIGTSIAYGVSRRWGSRWLNTRLGHRMVPTRSMNRTTALMERFGPWLLIPGRFLPGVRSVSSYVAGLGEMAFRSFLVYTMVGAILWCGTWISIGFWFGEHLDTILQMAQSTLAWITGAGIVCLLFVWLWRRQQLRGRH